MIVSYIKKPLIDIVNQGLCGWQIVTLRYKHSSIKTSWLMRLMTIIQHLPDVTTNHVPYLRPSGVLIYKADLWMQLTTQITKFYTLIVSTLVLFQYFLIIILEALFEGIFKISYFLISPYLALYCSMYFIWQWRQSFKYPDSLNDTF